jgi:hypothetical protein
VAAAFVQKVTFQGLGVNSSGATLPGVTAGNFLALMDATWGGVTNGTPSDDKTNAWSTTVQASTIGSGPSCPYINYAEDVAAGDTVVTVDHGTGYYTEGSLSEYSGLLGSSSLDQETSNSNAGSATPTSGTTGTTAQDDELVLACLGIDVNNTLGIDLPSGYTNLHIQQDANSSVGHSSDYLIVSATGTQAASWGTLTSSPPWSGKIATFKADLGGASPGPNVPGRGRGFKIQRMADDDEGRFNELDTRNWF